MMKKNINKQGFTLVELLVVIAIIGLLSTLSIVALNNARMRARDAVRIADVKQIQTALELYYTDVGRYPATLTFGTGKIENTTTTIVYMGQVPNNPLPADGACATNFDYHRDTFSSYRLEYCLGGVTGGIPSGNRTATNVGIND
jgi:prepilin-type N-terminal cleavage/methylation domain-containing protein